MSNHTLRIDHLEALTADGGLSRIDHVARGLVLTSREGGHDDLLCDYLDGVLAVQGLWPDEDSWALAVHSLGAVIACPSDLFRRNEAVRAFEKAAGRRPTEGRTVMVAALGAAQVLTVRPDNPSARNLLGDAARLVGPLASDPAWRWPEPQLTYAHAVVPEVLLASGSLLQRLSMVGDGLTLLGWLLDRGLDDSPVEVAAMADACARAFRLTGDARWADGVTLAAGWFDGHDDHGTDCMLARLSTLQQARGLTLSLV